VISVLFIAVGCLGMGNGAVFQLVPQRFADRMGLVTGIVGAAGGLGGFFLPSMLGAVKDATGSYGPGLLLLAGGFAGGAFALLQLGSVWVARWQPEIVGRSGVFCYRVAVRGSRVRGS
jgi:NNP family nitrate/nitrite transporter-like MFS transporter